MTGGEDLMSTLYFDKDVTLTALSVPSMSAPQIRRIQKNRGPCVSSEYKLCDETAWERERVTQSPTANKYQANVERIISTQPIIQQNACNLTLAYDRE